MAQERTDRDSRARAWRELVGGWRRSGLSQQAFCAQRRVALSTFTYWKRRLEGTGKNSVTGTTRRTVAALLAPKQFVPVRITAECKESIQPIELCLRNGRRLRFDSSIAADVLGRLAAALERDAQTC